MAGRAHQLILGLVIVALDGAINKSIKQSLPLPPQIGRHRPDALGQASDDTACIGEAKTSNDLQNQRVAEQLTDFLSPWRDGQYSTVVLGFPTSSESIVNTLLAREGVKHLQHLVLLSVPDELLHG
jgi:hypothetical protein